MSIFAPRPDNYAKYRLLRGSIIGLEGIIGAGKSTSGRSLERYLKKQGIRARYYPEFRNDEYLSLYISDMEKHAFGFQMFVLQTRISIYHEALAFADAGGVSIVDRCLSGDYAFALMQYRKEFITDSEWEVYLSVMKQSNVPTPDIILYLSCSPEVGFERMKRRNISSEVSGYNLEYFRELSNAYDETLAELNRKHQKTDSAEEDTSIVNEVCTVFEWNQDRSPQGGILDDKSCCLLLNKLITTLLRTIPRD